MRRPTQVTTPRWPFSSRSRSSGRWMRRRRRGRWRWSRFWRRRRSGVRGGRCCRMSSWRSWPSRATLLCKRAGRGSSWRQWKPTMPASLRPVRGGGRGRRGGEKEDEKDVRMMFSLVFRFGDVGSSWSGAPRVFLTPFGCRHHSQYEPKGQYSARSWLRSSSTTAVSCSGLVLLVTLRVAPCSLCFSTRQAHWSRSSSTTAVCTLLVLLVTLHFALCSQRLLSGPRCQASWPV